MDRAGTPTRSIRWWLIVYAAMVTPLDFGTLGLTSSGPDLIRWGALFPVWYVPVLVIAPRWGQLTDAMRRPPWSWLLVWAAMGSISILWAVAPTRAMIQGSAMLGLVLLAGWFVYAEGWFDFATGVVTGLTALIGAGILFDLANGTLISGTLNGRTAGLTSSPTTLGRLAALNIVMAAALIAWTRVRARPMVVPWAAIGASVMALAFAEARTAVGAAVVGLGYGGLRRLNPLNRWLVGGSVVVLAVSAFLISSAFVDDVASLSDRGNPATVSGRTNIWPVVIDLVVDRPLLGYGWGAEEQLFTQLARSGRITFVAFTTHSIALSPLISGGVVGFCLLAVAVASAIRLRRRVDAWVMAPVATILVGGLTEAIVHQPSVSLFVLSGSLAAIARVSRSRQRPDVERRRPHSATVTAASATRGGRAAPTGAIDGRRGDRRAAAARSAATR